MYVYTYTYIYMYIYIYMYGWLVGEPTTRRKKYIKRKVSQKAVGYKDIPQIHQYTLQIKIYYWQVGQTRNKQ